VALVGYFENWTPAQYRAAAAALGEHTESIMRLMRKCPDTESPRHAQWNTEAERIAIRLAVDAAHCARQALALHE